MPKNVILTFFTPRNENVVSAALHTSSTYVLDGCWYIPVSKKAASNCVYQQLVNEGRSLKQKKVKREACGLPLYFGCDT